MPIRVNLPDGSIGEFPDGMADADIERVLQQQFPTPSAAAPDFSGVSARVDSTAPLEIDIVGGTRGGAAAPMPLADGQLAAGNIDLNNRPIVRNADGSISTVRSISANFDGREVLIPTVSDDGRIMSDDEAINTYLRTGRNLGSFDTPEHANAYAESLHEAQANQYLPKSEAASQPNPANSSDFARMISGQPRQADGWEPGMARDAMFGLRSVLQGGGSLLGAVGGDAFNNYIVNPVARAVGAQEARPYREEAAALSDRLGLPRAQTASDRVLGDVGEALTGTGLTMGLGGLLNAGRSATPTVANRLGDFLTAQPVQQTIASAAGSAASGATRESGGSQGQQLAAGLVGGLGPSALSTLGSAGLRGLVRGADGQQMRSTIADFQALGATPSAGQASGRGWVQGLEGMLSKGPTSGGVIERFANQQADDIGQGLQAKASGLSPNPGSENAGLAIERGMKAFKGDTKAVKTALYWAADQQIPAATPTPMTSTQRALVQLTTPNPSAPATTGALIQPRIAALRQNLESDLQAGGGNITYDALRRIRSDIGDAIDGSSPLNPSPDLRELQRLYGALSQDMLAAAKARGPAAVKAAMRANDYTRNVANRMELVQRVIDKNGGPEKVFQAAMAGTNDGATTLRGVMYSLPAAEQKAVSAAVIKRMGMATPGAQGAAGDTFSAATFLTNWNKLSPESKAVLFGRYGSGFKGSMDQIARVAENIKNGSKVYANPSGSADKFIAYSYLAGLLSAIGSGHLMTAAGAAGAGLAANSVARVFTNPKAVNWLAMATTMPKGAFVANLQRMGAQANKSGDADMVELHDLLQQAVDQEDNAADEQQRSAN